MSIKNTDSGFSLQENCQDDSGNNRDSEKSPSKVEPKKCALELYNVNCNGIIANKLKENGDSTATSDTNSPVMPSSSPPPELAASSPNTRTSSPNHSTTLSPNIGNINGLRKSALKAALSLDPSTLCRGAIPYEKIAFSTPPARLCNSGSIELDKASDG